MLPEKRKPVADQATGFQSLEMLTSKIDVQEDTPNRLHLQAVRLRNRFAVSWPVARVVASLAYGEAR
ncbi:hypothetical protein ASD50_18340 [Mesorhizobium sp. Root552]|uniref:hypothetical protein n=1 Tax=Mesorhizobium sp. Root552 TaxID=1736555 RepID=UPI0006F35255|nr:hypothetical protein [Mesorhizobium sp. Root552]KQZ29151.1 hypothetical protein ASD50_18340 [Mesorhizobium sp. Root552]